VLFDSVNRQDMQDSDNISGRAKALFDKILTKAGLSRDDIYTANLSRCPNWEKNDKGWKVDTQPKSHQIQACKIWIKKELDELEPKYIITMGKSPSLILTGVSKSLPLKSIVYNKIVPSWTRAVVIPAYHPKTLLNFNDYETTKTVNLFREVGTLCNLVT